MSTSEYLLKASIFFKKAAIFNIHQLLVKFTNHCSYAIPLTSNKLMCWHLAMLCGFIHQIAMK